jgi:hypothetical protein
MRLLAAAIAFVRITSWLSRVLPGVWPTSTGFHQARLTYPIGYWNGLGILAAVGILLLVPLASDPREHAVVRAVFAAAVPVMAAVVLLTYSRGGLGALSVGLIVFAITSRTKTIFTSAIAIAPSAAVALVVTSRANLLASNTPTSSAAIAQGHHVASVTLCCVLAHSCSGSAATPLIADSASSASSRKSRPGSPEPRGRSCLSPAWRSSWAQEGLAGSAATSKPSSTGPDDGQHPIATHERQQQQSQRLASGSEGICGPPDHRHGRRDVRVQLLPLPPAAVPASCQRAQPLPRDPLRAGPRWPRASLRIADRDPPRRRLRDAYRGPYDPRRHSRPLEQRCCFTLPSIGIGSSPPSAPGSSFLAGSRSGQAQREGPAV